MEFKMFLMVFLWISVGGIVFSLFCLAMSGSGDHPEAFSTYLLCSSIILGFTLLSMAISSSKENKKE